jgi:hypothetical protein
MALEIDPTLDNAREFIKVIEESNLLVRNKPN